MVVQAVMKSGIWHAHKNWENRPNGLEGAKTCFLLFFLLLMQLGLSVTYLAPISTIFEIDVKKT